jgi:hypothetical protein
MNLYLNTMSLKNYFKLIATTLVLFASLATGLSQGVVHINRNVFVGQTEQFIHPATASGASVTPTIMVSPKKGTCTVSGGTVIYKADSTKEYLDTITIKYKVIKGVSYTDFVSYAIRVGKTFVSAKTDYAFTNKNQDVIVDVLANDAATDKNGNLDVVLNNVSLVNNGSYDIIYSTDPLHPNDNKIKFKPDNNFVGLAYVSYSVCDEIYLTCKTATLNIQVNNTRFLHQKM